MRITTTRRISQVFFLVLFIGFCLVSQPGDAWRQLGAWPVNWFLQLDPLVGLGTLLSTGTVYRGLLWGLATVGLTIVLGRFFCGWVCPFGTVHQFIGFLAHRKRPLSERIRLNRYQDAQRIKYWMLLFLLCAAGGDILAHPLARVWSGAIWISGMGLLLIFAVRHILEGAHGAKRTSVAVLFIAAVPALVNALLPGTRLGEVSLQTGVLDPIPLFHRSVNLVLMPVLDAASPAFSPNVRHYSGAWLIGTVFLVALCLNLAVPRFYCRFICPLGALFGVVGRFALWRIGKTKDRCSNCLACEAVCEGACAPSGEVRSPECVLCMNCFRSCDDDVVTFRTAPSASGEIASPDLHRRGVVTALVTGAAAIPFLRLEGLLGDNWRPGVVRPPGTLSEGEFLRRCIKCGQCMRVCPTNIIQPAALEAGLEGLWTPILNFRVGTSGCQLNCVECGHVCPTSAIRSLSLEEKLGLGAHAENGPVRLGTAFVDRGRCLPWAMDRPCIVCQENCPVSPKAILTRVQFARTLETVLLRVRRTEGAAIELEGAPLEKTFLATGDHYCAPAGQGEAAQRLIAAHTSASITLAAGTEFAPPLRAGDAVEIRVRLQLPVVDPERCIGCGICEHECPVSGRRAIRVTAENETREKGHALLPGKR